MIRQHAAAVVALLKANPNLTVFDRPVPDLTAPPYVRVYVSLDREDRTSLCNTSDEPHVRITTHSVGATDESAWIVSDQVRTSLLDVKPAVTGYVAGPIDHELGIPPQEDNSTGRPVLDVVDVWTFTSTPA